MRYRFLVMGCLLVIFASCHMMDRESIRGNGTIKTETRATGSFTGIDVSGNIDVYVKQDPASTVKVEADENLMEYIEITTEGNTLNIKPKEGTNLRSSNGIKVYVSNPSYLQFEVSGACDVILENKLTSKETISIDLSGASAATGELNAPKLKAELTGASTLSLSGETKDFYVDCAGASKARCFDLLAENAHVELSGASHADVFASVKLDANASGASHLKYKGNPAEVGQKVSGAASVQKEENP